MAIQSRVQEEEYFQVALGQGMYTSELPSNIPDGFSAMAYNMVATGDSLENRIGIRRSTVDWKFFDNPPGTLGIPNSEKMNIIYPLFPTRYDSAFPSFAWATQGYNVPANTVASSTLNFVRCAGNTATGDGIMSCPITGNGLVTGVTQYNDVVYFIINGVGVQKISVFNWATDQITYAQVASSANATMHGLFTFKDRLWAYEGKNLYYTDIPAPGALPETWAFASNFVPFVGPNGAGRIKRVIPMGNKLLVFTMAGLFTLLVEGPPASWILKILDSKSISTTNQCAFESKGIVYFINTSGVWATNGIYNSKISGVIEDQFFLAKGYRTHTIVPYEDGLLISISKHTALNSNTYDAPNCRIFYSKLDPVAWTEWNIETKSTVGTPIAKNRLCNIHSTTDKISTYLNSEPVVFSLMFVTDTKEGDLAERPLVQLLIFDGGEDQIVTKTNTVVTAPINLYLKTKQMDGGNPYNLKQNKRGLLEIFTSDAEHKFTTSWEIDATTTDGQAVRQTPTRDYTVGTGSNLIQIPSGFHYRRCGLIWTCDLQSNDSQVKIKDMAIVQNTERGEFELVR